MENISIKTILSSPRLTVDKAIIQGWVKTLRSSKSITFIHVNDGSCLSDIQIVIPNDHKDHRLIAYMGTGASIRIVGKVVESPATGQKFEIHAHDIELIGTADPVNYPLQKKRHSLDFLREIAHLRPRTNTFGAMARIRNSVAFSIHTFFQKKGFLYIQTPIITTSDAEGSGNLFRVTTLDPDTLRTTRNSQDFEDFFGKPAYLTVSGQLEAEIFASALTNVYTFGPTFRAENSNTSRHLAEFWMVEPEMAFCDINGLIKLAEEFLKYIYKHVLESCFEDIEFFNQWQNSSVISTLENIIASDFEHITYTEAIRLLNNSDQQFAFPVEWGLDLQSEHERYITEHLFGKPVVITNYPKDIKAFYMRLNDDQETVAAMDILVPRIGEIVGGSQREERHDLLLSRIEATELSKEDYWWYLDLRKYGSVPHSGFGLGFERMIQFITGAQNIRDVAAFPRTPGNAQF